ncbi:MAG TPA: saccharopine dehydrogenase NADP-binding domain-containing protein [Thermoplasmata archaeon]|nr:saccharopine dehydrogenase NADP-binding domain-containing protein [Thermoplasmata archaeon]
MVLGAGAIGSVTATLLAKSPKVERLIIADRSLEAAKALAARLPASVAIADRIDASKVDTMAEAFKGNDMVLNLVLPRFNLKIMDACLKAGVHYMDAATDLALAKEKPGEIVPAPPEALQLAYDDAFRNAGLTALLGMGQDPGISNILARVGADRLDVVQEIEVRDGDAGSVEGYEFASLWSVDTLIEEVLMPALAFRDGKLLRLGSLEGEEVFEFPAPVGPLTVYNVDHEETNTLPLTIGKGLESMDFKIAIPEDLAHALKVFQKFGLHRGRPIEVEVKSTGEKVHVAPRDMLAALMPDPKTLSDKAKGPACLAVVVRGLKADEKAGWMLWMTLDHQECYRRYGFNATSYPVGAPMAMAAEMLARGEITRRGAFPLEVLDPEPFLKHFPEYGIVIQEKRLA